MEDILVNQLSEFSPSTVVCLTLTLLTQQRSKQTQRKDVGPTHTHTITQTVNTKQGETL